MGKIFYLIGRGGTGKSTLAKGMCREFPNLKLVPEYTTRPKREDEISGTDHVFITEEEGKKMVANNEILATFSIESVYGMWYYYIRKNDIDISSNNYIMTGNPITFSQLRDYFGGDIIPIWMTVSEFRLYQRCITRELKKDQPEMEEMERRFNSDKVTYSEDVKKQLGIDYTVDNTYYMEGIAGVSKIIEENMEV